MGSEYLKAIIKLDDLNKHTEFNTTEPKTCLKPYIERFWSVEYDLPKDTYFTQQIIPNPHVSIVKYNTENEVNTYVEGVVKKLFTVKLMGKGWILGAKFHIGGLSYFTETPASHFTNQKLKFSDAFDMYQPQSLDMKNSLLDNIHAFETDLEFLLQHTLYLNKNSSVSSKRVSEKIRLVNDLVRQIRDNSHITTVEQIATYSHISVRTLQRLFNQYVGVNPKWIIRMFRLQEVKTYREKGNKINWSAVALELGYSDQSHLIHDYNSLFKE